MPRTPLDKPPLAIALGGLAALASGMGLGRFLYTPVLPMMADGAGLSPTAGGLIAAANFAGYLAGALAAALLSLAGDPRNWLLGALVLGALTTAAMAVADGPPAWAVLRGLSGVASAFVLVSASALVVRRLTEAGRPELGSVHFAGVGVGIVLSALIASPALAADVDWRRVWISGAILMALAVPAVIVAVPPADPLARGRGERAQPAAPGLWRLILGYGCLGFGYVITATFLVAILREQDATRWAEAGVWSVVGLAAIPSVAVWAAIARRFGPVLAWRAAMLTEATGVGLSAVTTGPVALAIAAAALGGTFIALTAIGLREAARRTGGADSRRIMGLMTAAFGTGQMLGPGIAGALREASGSYTAPSLIAAAVLVAGALIVRPARSPALEGAIQP